LFVWWELNSAVFWLPHQAHEIDLSIAINRACRQQNGDRSSLSQFTIFEAHTLFF